MTVAALFGYAAALVVAGRPLLLRGGWTDRAPRLAIAAWLALSAAIVLARLLGGLVLLLPTVELSADLAALLETCAMALQSQYGTPGGAVLSTTGGLLALAMIVRMGYALIVTLVAAGRGRRRQRTMLALVARREERTGALVVDHGAAAAYCLPGRRRQIVLTSAALAALNDEELAAVLAHERAHLRGRHDLALALASAFERAFPFVPAFRTARAEVPRLVELIADDAAARCCPRRTVASALVALAAAAVPAAALGAGGPNALSRVQRLLAPARPLGRLRLSLGAVGVAALLTVPLVVAAEPAVGALMMDFCPLPPA